MLPSIKSPVKSAPGKTQRRKAKEEMRKYGINRTQAERNGQMREVAFRDEIRYDHPVLHEWHH